MNKDVASILARETMPLDTRSIDELVELEERSPGTVRSTSLGVFDRPDGPLETDTLREGVEPTSLYTAEAGRVLADALIDWATTVRLYPGAAQWRAVYDVANQHGVFDNPLTDQLGISQRKR